MVLRMKSYIKRRYWCLTRFITKHICTYSNIGWADQRPIFCSPSSVLVCSSMSKYILERYAKQNTVDQVLSNLRDIRQKALLHVTRCSTKTAAVIWLKYFDDECYSKQSIDPLKRNILIRWKGIITCRYSIDYRMLCCIYNW